MAVKIITRGVNPKDKIYRATCQNCKTVFDFQDSDAVYRSSTDPRETDYYAIDCPVCKHVCLVSPSSISPESPGKT